MGEIELYRLTFSEANQLVGGVAFYKLTFYPASQLVGEIGLYRLTFSAANQLVEEIMLYKLTSIYHESACGRNRALQADYHLQQVSS